MTHHIFNINSSDIVEWAQKYGSNSEFPTLICDLINECEPRPTIDSFPTGDDVHIHGYDGEVSSNYELRWVPLGKSVWEVSTEQDYRGKVNRQFDQRTEKPLHVNPHETTYIAVTSCKWSKVDREKWIAGKVKKEESKWKAIKVYDAVDLELWLKQSPVTSFKFFKTIKKMPDGLQNPDDYLKEKTYFLNCDGKFNSRIFLQDQDLNVSNLDRFFEKQYSHPIQIHSNTKEDALVFLTTYLQNREDLNSRAIICKTPDAMREISKAFGSIKLIIIPDFEGELPITHDMVAQHHIIIPSKELETPDPTAPNIISVSFDEVLLKEELIKIGTPPQKLNELMSKSNSSFALLRKEIRENGSFYTNIG